MRAPSTPSTCCCRSHCRSSCGRATSSNYHPWPLPHLPLCLSTSSMFHPVQRVQRTHARADAREFVRGRRATIILMPPPPSSLRRLSPASQNITLLSDLRVSQNKSRRTNHRPHRPRALLAPPPIQLYNLRLNHPPTPSFTTTAIAAAIPVDHTTKCYRGQHNKMPLQIPTPSTIPSMPRRLLIFIDFKYSSC